MKVNFTDKFFFPNTERTFTKEGYLIVPANISRPGTQMYRACELQGDGKLPENFKPNDAVIVYRPPEEVFDKESIDSFKNIAVTNNHPPEFLNAKNHRKYSVGVVLSDVERVEDKYIHGTIKITDIDMINEINNGKVDVSAGYDSQIFFEDGETPEGEAYQAVQRSIRGNHVAVVARGRAGSEIKIADGLEEPSARSESLLEAGIKSSAESEKSESFMGTGGADDDEDELGFDEVPGDSAQNPFGDAEPKTTPKIKDVIEDIENNEEENTAMQLKDALETIETLKQQNATLSTQIVDQEMMDKMVEDRVNLIDACQRICPGMEMKGKSNFNLKKEVVLSKLKEEDMSDKSESYFNAAFDIMVNDAKIVDNTSGKHDPDVYGEDLAFKDESETAEGVEQAESVELAAVTNNTKEGVNEDENGNESDEDESVAIDKVENNDSVSTLDSAFSIESNLEKSPRGLTAYQKFCKRSREEWKNK